MGKPTSASQAFSAAIARQARAREVVPVRDPKTGAVVLVPAVELEDARKEAEVRAAVAGRLGRSDAGAGRDAREPAETPQDKMTRLIRRAAEPWDGRLGDDYRVVDG